MKFIREGIDQVLTDSKLEYILYDLKKKIVKNKELSIILKLPS